MDDQSRVMCQWGRPTGPVELLHCRPRRERWRGGRSKGGVLGEELRYVGGVELYDPLDAPKGEPTLLHALLQLPVRDPEAFRDFAQEHGLLGLHAPEQMGGGRESAWDWNQAVGRLQLAWEAWHAARDGDRDLLEPLGEDVRRDLGVGHLPLSQLREIGFSHAESEVSEHLLEGVALDVVRKGPELRAILVARTLQAAAWLQFSDVTAGAVGIERCPGRCQMGREQRCQDWFLVRARRKNDVYCSEACRQAAFRFRAKTRQLGRSRRRPSTIARELGIDPKLVREWLATGRARGRGRRST